MSEGGLRIVVLGYLVRGPLGGLSWHHLQYLLGFAALGHDVWFLEDSEDDASCYDPRTFELTADPSYGLRYAGAALARIGFGERWAYLDRHTGRWLGPAGPQAGGLVATADAIVNVSGVNPLHGAMLDVPVRLLVDTDPVFTQVRHRHDAAAREAAARHTAFATFATSTGSPGCSVPDDGFPWRPTRQPVVAEAWPLGPLPERRRFTTVMQWSSYATVEDGGRTFGVKAQSFEVVRDLPGRVAAELEVALGSAGAPRDDLAARGWAVVDPGPISEDPWTYQAYLQGSFGELAVAKHGYVASGSGWFSERSCGYLASGRPVVAQDTGWSAWLETGAGAFAFSDADGAAAALDDVLRRPAAHAAAARELVVEHFDARIVLAELLG